ncbi:MAG: ATP-grasp domain-containing protein [Lachnospiraceae bacterium]|nr:ATP-grasp domain-containing protein [Lachnospiraceae bacterium]
MKVYIQTKEHGQFNNDNFFKAYLGFREMGFETVTFSNNRELSESNMEDIVVGFVGTVRSRLNDFGISVPELNYPDELSEYLGRKIWKSHIDTINCNPDLWPVFVKSVRNKKFTGVVVKEPKDLIGCGSCYDNAECLCSEVVNFIAEWRVFIRYGSIVDVRPYKGDWRAHFDYKVIEDAVKRYTTAPNGYAIDFGLTDDGRTLLVEVNDGYALGSYGLYYPEYAKLLSARWAELTNTQDECDF